MKTYHDIAAGSDVAEQVTAHAERMAARLKDVRRIVAVMSGKGGVGKSTVAANLAAALVLRGWKTGLVDGDINGPCLGRMMGVRGTPIDRKADGIRPATSRTGVRVMSMDLFLEDETTPVVWDAPSQSDGAAWRGLREAGALRELIADTDWGALDVLLIDLPPGSDRLPTLAGILPELDGAIVVTLPTAVSQGVVARSIRMVREHLHVPILGLVENMAAHVCPHCGREDVLFPTGQHQVASHDIPLLARIPFDPALGLAGDDGSSFPHRHPDRPATAELVRLASELENILQLS